MHIHILGICGTFMGSLAILAKELGYRVSGADQNVYPPMSTQLERAGIELHQGYGPDQLDCGADLIVVGNAMSRGNPVVEAVLNNNLPYVSGPQWLAEHVLKDRWVLAVAGTHGKTTTSSMLAWVLEAAGLAPGFLIGGVPRNFDISARLGKAPFFVVEADEYDTAFFDKRSKFVHYGARTAILNNLEFDHADIFDDLAAIQRQFHHFVRTIPGEGLIVAPTADDNIQAVLGQGCWTPVEGFSLLPSDSGWSVKLLREDGSHYQVLLDADLQGEVNWDHTGLHNVANGVAAIAAARHTGVQPAQAIEALNGFRGVKRRMELLDEVNGVKIFDDFAHHPTAIATTLDGLRKQVGDGKVVAIIEPRSNTMRMGAHGDRLAGVCSAANEVIWYQPENVDWHLAEVVEASPVPAQVFNSIDAIVDRLCEASKPGDHLVIMSNGGFAGIHQKLIDQLKQGAKTSSPAGSTRQSGAC